MNGLQPTNRPPTNQNATDYEFEQPQDDNQARDDDDDEPNTKPTPATLCSAQLVENSDSDYNNY